MGGQSLSTPGNTKTKQKQIAMLERDMQALELRKAGATLLQISKQLSPEGKLINTGQISRMIQRAMRSMYYESADEYRQMQMARYEAMILSLWQRAIGGRDPVTKALLAPDYQAVDRVLKIMAQQATLMGLNAPLRVDWRVMVAQAAADMGLSEDERQELISDVRTHMAMVALPAGH